MTLIAAAQLAPTLGDLKTNRILARDAIREAAQAGADVVVLPELVTSGYVFESPEEARSVAIALDHEILKEWGGAPVGPGNFGLATRRHRSTVQGDAP